MTTRTRSKLIVAADAAEFARVAAEWIAKKASAAVRARGVCSIALAGGSTPRPVYAELDRLEKFPWAEAEFYFGDERCVPIDHPESNYRMVRETLLKSHAEALGRLARMPADAPDREKAADRYARRLPDPLDLLVLGMGEDGHTASLFPGSAALDETSRRVVPAAGPREPRERMTITPPVIERARSIVVLASGITKAHMVSRALGGLYLPKEVPVQLARRGTWIVDHAAATYVLNP